MKCKHCGAEIGLEENYCRYCGQPNDQALRHTQDMTNYHRRYAATETAVVSRTKRYSQIILRAARIHPESSGKRYPQLRLQDAAHPWSYVVARLEEVKPIPK